MSRAPCKRYGQAPLDSVASAKARMEGGYAVEKTTVAPQEARGAVEAREADLARRNKELAALVEASRAVVSSLDLEQSLQAIVRNAASIAGVPAVRLFLVDEEAQVLRWRVGIGLPPEVERDLVIPFGESFSGQVVATGKPVAVPDTRGDPRLHYPQHAMQYGLLSYLGLPVKIGDRVFGVLVFNTYAPRVYAEDEIAFLSAFADQAAIAIENAWLYEAIRHHAQDLEVRVRDRTAELEEALRVKSELLRRMSHELRTPLNFVLGFSEILQHQAAGPLTPKQARYVDRIHSGGKRLLELVTALLDISQVQFGESRLHLESVPLTPLVHEVLAGIHPQAARKGLTVTPTLDPGLPCVVGDRPKLMRILGNLVANAVKFTPAGGHVTVTARRIAWPSGGLVRGQLGVSLDPQIPHPPEQHPAGEGVELAVEDTGIGLRAEDLEAVFEVFYQVDGSETRAFEGAGLGLTQVRKFVALHHGRVWAESAGPGHGSRFVVQLPCLELPQAPRILLVEDEATVRTALATTLQIAGYAVTQASTVAEALMVLPKAAPDLLVLDIGLHDMAGWGVLKGVRRMGGTGSLPVLILTSLEQVHAEQALALGADEFLTKPVSGRVLVQTVTRLLAEAGMQSGAVGPGAGRGAGNPSK
jgi:signal transduction histidine kinase/CheY-like chemotaxis protein